MFEQFDLFSVSQTEVDSNVSLFDLVDEPNELDVSESEMVEIISKATGLDFKYVDEFWKYQAKTRYCVFRLHYSTYKTNECDGQRFISCGYDYKKDGQIGGCGSPCDSIDEAIKFFNKGKERWC